MSEEKNIEPKEFLKRLFNKAIENMAPEKAMQDWLSLKEENLLQVAEKEFDIKEKKICVFAAGKASLGMYRGIEKLLGNRIADSFIIGPGDREIPNQIKNIYVEGTHPTPDGKSQNAGKRAVEFFKQVEKNSLLLCLISGGTSSLMCLPAGEITIDELNRTHELLINSGADIREVNVVRKHCSQVKGGQLLRHLEPAIQVANLLISDVPGDDPEVIGSGPTVSDNSSFLEAIGIIRKYNLWERLPKSVQNHMQSGNRGETSETIESTDVPGVKITTHIISSARQLAEEAAALAGEEGMNTEIAEEAYEGDVERVASEIAGQAISVAKGEGGMERPALLIYYGESTVQVNGPGKGGRNQELSLRGALEIEGWSQITWLSAGTDGIDGPTDAAGAVVDGYSINDAINNDVDPVAYLQKNDSYHFHERMNTLLKTGPTGQNLMDVTWIFVDD